MDWTQEINKMLGVFEQQAMQSLGVIKLAFRSNGIPFFTPTFKEYFLRASINRLSETFDRFEIKSKLEDQILAEFSDNMERGHTSNESTWEVEERSQQNVPALERFLSVNNACSDIVNQNVSTGHGNMETAYPSVPASQIDDSDDETVEALETEPIADAIEVGNDAPSNTMPNEIDEATIASQNTSDANNPNDSPVPTDDLHGINESNEIAHQSNTNESDSIELEDSKVPNFAVEFDESNDSIEMVENQTASIDAGKSDLNPVDVALNRSDETTSGRVIKGKNKAKRLNRKRPNKNRTTAMHMNWISVAPKGEKSPPKQSAKIRFECDRCGKTFARSPILLKHAATHIEDFPFHCRVCFRGFASKIEAMDHENHCRKFHYECFLCKKLITCVRHDLIRHMRKHTGDKPFHCEICMKGFVQKHNLKRHTTTIHA